MFALESLVDMLCEKTGADPLEFRKMNSMEPGGTRSTGAPIEQFPFPELCEGIKPHYDRARKDATEFNKKGGKIKRGVGIAEAGDQSQVFVDANGLNMV